METYNRFTLRYPEHQEESITALLWQGGTLGIEILEPNAEGAGLEAWFSPDDFLPVQLRSLLVRESREQDQDWLAEYRRHAQPFEVGNRFIIDPRDEGTVDFVVPEGRIGIKIPARNAFGTGSHETTRAMVERLEARLKPGCSVLDVGSGSGILSFVAEALGARRVVGFDTDLASIFQAKLMANLNQKVAPFFAGGIEALQPYVGFDLVVVNILPQNVIHSAPSLVDQLGEGGLLLYGGFLWTQRESISETWRDAGLQVRSFHQMGEWATLEGIR